MAYHHPSYNPTSGQYTAGDVNSHVEYMVNSGTPGYAVRFYSPTDFEQISELGYRGKVSYDKGMNNFLEMLKGLPLDAYMPISFGSMDNGSASPTALSIRTEVTLPDKVKREIENAQKKFKNVEKKNLEASELILRETIVEEMFLRRVRQREIHIRK